jgi:IclR family pca regulon transcriptional regulator
VAVLQNDAVIIVARGIWQGSDLPVKASHTVLAYGLHVGTRLPAHATSTGQVLLANLPAAQLKTWLSTSALSRLTSHTATQAKDLKQKLKLVAQQDYCCAAQEHELGVDALAVPLRNDRGETVAALNLVRSGAGSNAPDLATRWLPLLQQTAQTLRPLI